MASANPQPEVLPQEETETRTRRQPPYAVILHNDDLNGMDFVVGVLRKVFGYTVPKCFELMLEAHEHLINADAGNAAKFQDVLAFLRNRVESGR